MQETTVIHSTPNKPEVLQRMNYLFEFSISYKSILTMPGSCTPPNAVLVIEINPGLSFHFRKDLQTVVVDEHVRRAALEFIG